MNDRKPFHPHYEQLADKLNRIPNGFPRTQSGVELRLLAKLFSEEDAALACSLSSACDWARKAARAAR